MFGDSDAARYIHSLVSSYTGLIISFFLIQKLLNITVNQRNYRYITNNHSNKDNWHWMLSMSGILYFKHFMFVDHLVLTESLWSRCCHHHPTLEVKTLGSHSLLVMEWGLRMKKTPTLSSQRVHTPAGKIRRIINYHQVNNWRMNSIIVLTITP